MEIRTIATIANAANGISAIKRSGIDGDVSSCNSSASLDCLPMPRHLGWGCQMHGGSRRPQANGRSDERRQLLFPRLDDAALHFARLLAASGFHRASGI